MASRIAALVVLMLFGKGCSLEVSSLTCNYMVNPIGLKLSGASPRLSWVLSGTLPQRGLRQTHYQLLVNASGALASWDSGAVASTEPWASYAGAVLPDTHYTWRVKVFLNDGSALESAPSSFHTGVHAIGGDWITGDGNLFRAEFSTPATPKQATLLVSGIGYFELKLNGLKVGSEMLAPGWTDFAKRVYYSTYDVSGLLVPGATNAIGVALGNGWWSCGDPSQPTTQPGCADEPPQLRLELLVDGEAVLQTDAASDAWRCSSGPITYDSLYNGERYDARLEQPGWASAGFDDGAWGPVRLAQSVASSAKLESASFEPIRHLSTFAPRSVTSPASGVQVFDFGQNMAGVVRLKRIAGCPRGQNITIRTAEVLMHLPYGPADGGIYTGNLRAAKSTDVYTCRGGDEPESYAPTFTQHGFRYAELSGLGRPLREEELEAVEMHTDVRRRSDVVFGGEPLLNEIQHAVVWGQKSNLMTVPTDCPQRDERRGWTGDAALTAEEALYNFEMGALYSHWLRQLVDDQGADGSIANYVPSLGAAGGGAPNWQSAFPSIVHGLWWLYGDASAVDEHFDALVKYVDNFEREYNKTGVAGFQTGFGDWVPPPPQPQANAHLVGAFALLNDVQRAAQFFGASTDARGAAQAARAAALSASRIEKLGPEFHEAFYDAAHGYYGSGLQTEQAMALSLPGVVPEELRAAVLAYTVDDIVVTHANHTTSGIIGIKLMLELLTREGHGDVALTMVLEESYPSYGYMLRGPLEPATTIWELWNSDVAGPGMNSRNHIMFGTVSSWFYNSLLGVVPTEPGFAKFAFRPSGVGHARLTHAAASVPTPRGEIEAAWELSAARTCAVAEENAVARVSCPASAISDVVFAAYGTPTGSCEAGDLAPSDACDATAAAEKIRAACVGKTSCEVPATNDFVGGDPCNGTPKRLAVAVACSGEGGGTRALVQRLRVPVGAAATILVPTLGAAGATATTVLEGGSAVWRDGAFVPGAAEGVVAGKLAGDGRGIELSLQSGSYTFESSFA